MPQNKNTQSGNVFMIVLIGVLLFAALGYTFSKSMNKGTGNLTKQQARVGAQEILNYARLVESAVDRVRRNGCSETEISFDNTVVNGYSNTNTRTDGSCSIFNDNGGKLEYALIKEDFLWDFYSTSAFWQKPEFRVGHQILEIGSASDELLFVGFHIKESVCSEINNLVSVDNPSGSPPEDDTPAASQKFTGSFPGALDTLGDESTEVSGERTFCRKTIGSTDPVGQFIHVLLER